MTFTVAEMLHTAGLSLIAAGSHDRGGWVGLFAEDAMVEDPVGSWPHIGSDRIARFYDTFIAARGIGHHAHTDIVTGHTVIRDLDLHVNVTPQRTLQTPAYLRYDLSCRNDELKIARLRAYWELPAALRQIGRAGTPALAAGGRLTAELARHQGLGGVMGFAAGLRGVGGPGKQSAERFLGAVCAGNEIAVRRQLARTAPVTLGDLQQLGAAGLISRLRGGRPDKLVVSGRSVAARIRPGAGDGTGFIAGVVIVDVQPKVGTITRVRYFESQPRGESQRQGHDPATVV